METTKEMVKAIRVKGGMKNHPLYATWTGMMSRCHKPYHATYKYYGAKGVTVDERWHKFWNFVYDIDNHMPNGHLLYRKDYQLDKDVNGGMIYSLEKCVVMSKEKKDELNRIKRQKKIVAFNDTTEIQFESLSAAQSHFDIKRQTLIHCLKRGNVHQKTGFRFKYVD